MASYTEVLPKSTLDVLRGFPRSEEQTGEIFAQGDIFQTCFRCWRELALAAFGRKNGTGKGVNVWWHWGISPALGQTREESRCGVRSPRHRRPCNVFFSMSRLTAGFLLQGRSRSCSLWKSPNGENRVFPENRRPQGVVFSESAVRVYPESDLAPDCQVYVLYCLCTSPNQGSANQGSPDRGASTWTCQHARPIPAT